MLAGIGKFTLLTAMAKTKKKLQSRSGTRVSGKSGKSGYAHQRKREMQATEELRKRVAELEAIIAFLNAKVKVLEEEILEHLKLD